MATFRGLTVLFEVDGLGKTLTPFTHKRLLDALRANIGELELTHFSTLPSGFRFASDDGWLTVAPAGETTLLVQAHTAREARVEAIADVLRAMSSGDCFTTIRPGGRADFVYHVSAETMTAVFSSASCRPLADALSVGTGMGAYQLGMHGEKRLGDSTFHVHASMSSCGPEGHVVIELSECRDGTATSIMDILDPEHWAAARKFARAVVTGLEATAR